MRRSRKEYTKRSKLQQQAKAAEQSKAGVEGGATNTLDVETEKGSSTSASASEVELRTVNTPVAEIGNEDAHLVPGE